MTNEENSEGNNIKYLSQQIIEQEYTETRKSTKVIKSSNSSGFNYTMDKCTVYNAALTIFEVVLLNISY